VSEKIRGGFSPLSPPWIRLCDCTVNIAMLNCFLTVNA